MEYTIYNAKSLYFIDQETEISKSDIQTAVKAKKLHFILNIDENIQQSHKQLLETPDIVAIQNTKNKINNVTKYIHHILHIQQQYGCKICINIANLFTSGICKSFLEYINFIKKYKKSFNIVYLTDVDSKNRITNIFQGNIFSQKEIIKNMRILIEFIDNLSVFILSPDDCTSEIARFIQYYKSKNIVLNRLQLQEIFKISSILAINTLQNYDKSERDMYQSRFKFQIYQQIQYFIYDLLSINSDTKEFNILGEDLQKYQIHRKFIYIAAIILLIQPIDLKIRLNINQNMQQYLLCLVKCGFGFEPITNILKTNEININICRQCSESIINADQANSIIAEFADMFQLQNQYLICGQLKRNANQAIRNIDLVVNSDIQNILLSQFENNKQITIQKQGKITKLEYKTKLMKQWPVIIYIVFANQSELPFASLFTTGNKYFNLGLKSRAKKLKMKLGTWNLSPQSQQLQIKKTESWQQTADNIQEKESKIFQILGLKYIAPQYRLTLNLSYWIQSSK